MQDYTYLSVIILILSLSGCLDTLFSMLGIRKRYAAFLFISCIFLSYLVPDISGVQIVPSSLLIISAFAVFSYAEKELNVGQYLGWTVVLGIFSLALLYLFPILTIEVISAFSAAVAGIVLRRRPAMSMLICASFPLLTYIATLFADFFYYFGENLPTAYTVYTAQIAGIIISAATNFAAQTISMRFKHRTDRI